MKRILLLFIILITLIGCKEDNDCQGVNCLPPETQTGANTFGFLVNGKPINVTNTSQQTAFYQGGILHLGGGIDTRNKDIRVMLTIYDPIQLGVNYNLTEISDYKAVYIYRDSNNNCYYDYPNTIQGFVKLTNLDQTNFIVSGTFEFSTNKDGCEDINITNGRFDLQYTP